MKKNQIILFYGLTLIFSFFYCDFSDAKNRADFKDDKIVAYQMSPFSINQYKPGEPVFSDRPYYDHIKDDRLNGLFLVKIPRHLSFDIVLKLDKDTTVYRAICDDNRNDFSSWIKTNIIMTLGGQSCINLKIVKKVFQKGTHFLKPGGDLTSSPVFLEIQKGDL
jgi:hypothetical protein